MIDDRIENTPREPADDPLEVEGTPEYHINDDADTNPDRAFEQKPLPEP
ncbi:MAG: hypothetical protein ABI596_11785 [Pyrinomonadaceae bacterium]